MALLPYCKAFFVGGLICLAGQILIDRTGLTPARILTGAVVLGVLLGALGLYQPLVDFAGAGASVPLLGFGSALYKTNEDFLTPTHTAYRGRVLAVFRAGEAGTVTVTATAADGQTTTQTWEATA